MLSQLILRHYPKIIEACLWLITIANFFVFGAVSKFEFNVIVGLVGMIVTFIACAIISGGLIILIDMHKLLIELRQKD